MWCSFKRRNSSNKKKQDKENRVELDSKDHSKKKFGRDFLKNLQPRLHCAGDRTPLASLHSSREHYFCRSVRGLVGVSVV